MGMSFEVEKLEHNMVKITLEADASQLEQAIEQSYRKERGNISIPGFRKGKVPRKMIEKMYGAGVFYEEAADSLIPKMYDEMLAEQKELEIVSQPKIEVTQIEQGKPFIFTAEVAVKPEVKLGEYKGLEVTLRETAVSDEELEKALDQERNRNARTVEVTDRPVQDGDIVKLDFDGYIDGEPFEGGKGEGYPLTIGSGSFIPGFEEQLIGVSIDEDKDVNVKFPEDYHAEDLKGKDATFKCKVTSISARELPELDDEFASDVSDFETLEEYKQDLRDKLVKQKEDDVKRQKENEAVDAAIANAEMDIPDAMVDSQVDQMLEDFSRQLSAQGITAEQYMQFTGATADTLRASMRPDALHRIQSRLVLEAIVEAENIETSDERLEEELENMAKMYDMEVGKMKEVLNDEQKDVMKKDIAVQEAITMITDAAKEVEKAEADDAAEEKTEE